MTEIRNPTRGQRPAHFPVTRQSAICALSSLDQATRTAAYEAVLACYWKPTYKLIRLKWSVSPETAEDLTQGFFATAFEKRFFEQYDPKLARFHTFLRTCLERYLMNQQKYESRLRRAGNKNTLSLDFEDAEEELTRYQVSQDISQDEFLYREWVRSLLGLAVEALRLDCSQRGREVHFELFEAYDLEDNQYRQVTYQSLALKHGLSTTAVTNYLASVRRDFRRLVLEKLREQTASDEEFRAEARSLLGVELS
jgi:DNA-directed RNA polymerase specialized sigma24 family protein